MNSAEFLIRPATCEDLDGIMAVMESAKADTGPKGWFVADEADFIKSHIKEAGFIMVAEPIGSRKQIAAFFAVHIPGAGKENLGRDAGFTGPQLFGAAHMESAAVLPEYRGHGLQGRLLEEAEARLQGMGFRYLFATVHPDNGASLHTMKKHGYKILVTKEKYGGLLRHVLKKKDF